jgi:hypothetical protein
MRISEGLVVFQAVSSATKAVKNSFRLLDLRLGTDGFE